MAEMTKSRPGTHPGRLFNVAGFLRLAQGVRGIFFEVRSLIWPDRSQNGTMLDAHRPDQVTIRLVSLYGTLSCA